MANKEYSVVKGMWKGLVGISTALVAVIAFLGIADVEVWAFLEQHVKPLVGTMTVGGLFAMALNWVKFQANK